MLEQWALTRAWLQVMDKMIKFVYIHALTALVDMKEIPEKTSVCIIADKEEIGSMGNTGMESHVFDNFIAELLNKLGINRPNLLDKVFCHSKMLSADVDAGLDPIYANVSEKNNACLFRKRNRA